MQVKVKISEFSPLLLLSLVLPTELGSLFGQGMDVFIETSMAKTTLSESKRSTLTKYNIDGPGGASQIRRQMSLGMYLSYEK